MGRKSDYPPSRFFDEPMPDGPGKGAHLDHADYEVLLTDAHYTARGWDPATGHPTPEKLKELELVERG